jgi:hypothetical protein
LLLTTLEKIQVSSSVSVEGPTVIFKVYKVIKKNIFHIHKHKKVGFKAHFPVAEKDETLAVILFQHFILAVNSSFYLQFGSLQLPNL